MARRHCISDKFLNIDTQSNLPSNVALSYFDKVYAAQYGKKWPSIRLALLSPSHYAILHNNYSHSYESIEKLKEDSSLLKSVWDILDLDTFFAKYNHDEDVKSSEESQIKETVQGSIKNDEQRFSVDEKISRLVDFSHMPVEEIVDVKEMMESYENVGTQLILSNDVPIIKEMNFFLPKNINFYLYYDPYIDYNLEENPFKSFPPAPMMHKGLIEYYTMDASSIIPVLALEIKPGNHILDMCAAPGGKALTAIQTLNFETITCLEKSESRYNRLQKMFHNYLPKGNKFRQRVKCIHTDAVAETSFVDSFDRVLVDVPCTSDRKSIEEDDNNLFHRLRFNERANLPRVQTSLLVQGILNLKPGGKLVYSTCTLSPAQNENIIMAAHYEITRKYPDIKFRVVDCSHFCQLFSSIFRFYKREDSDEALQQPSIGHLIIPYLPANWGPLYFCKIERIN